MYKLKYETQFAAAHQLKTAYSKECNDFLHGHNWEVIAEIETKELVNDMVIDFKKLKEIIHKLDHKNLVDILPFQTTAENIAKYLHNEIKKEVKQESKVTIKLWEAEKSCIEYYV